MIDVGKQKYVKDTLECWTYRTCYITVRFVPPPLVYQGHGGKWKPCPLTGPKCPTYGDVVAGWDYIT